MYLVVSFMILSGLLVFCSLRSHLLLTLLGLEFMVLSMFFTFVFVFDFLWLLMLLSFGFYSFFCLWGRSSFSYFGFYNENIFVSTYLYTENIF